MFIFISLNKHSYTNAVTYPLKYGKLSTQKISVDIRRIFSQHACDVYSRFLVAQFERAELLVEDVRIDAVRLEITQEVGVLEPVTVVFILAQSAQHHTHTHTHLAR